MTDEAAEAINTVIGQLKSAAQVNECLCDYIEMELAVTKTQEGGAHLKLGLIPGIELGGSVGGDLKTNDHSIVKVRFTPYLSEEDTSQLAKRSNITRPKRYPYK